LLEKPFQIRQFEEADLNKIVHINLTCLPENYSRKFYIDIFHRFPKTFLVAVDNGVIGYLMCRIETGLSEIKSLGLARKGHIVSVAVLPEYRKRGVGRALVVEALKGMLDYNASESYLEVRVSNFPAIFLYKGLRFRPVRRIAGYYRDGEDAYVMALPLKG
jgi:ribosomal-protein-alanine N-acetyltransferase